MRDDTSTRMGDARTAGRGEFAEVGLPLEELVRRGAQEILQRFIEAELQVMSNEYV